MNSGYESFALRADYFLHLVEKDLTQAPITEAPVLYEKDVTNYNEFSSFFTLWNPIKKTEVVGKTTPIICTFSGTQTLFDAVKDLSLFAAYWTNDYLNTTLLTVYNELDQLINILKPYVEGEGRHLHFISHSLGSTLSNYVAYKLLSTSNQIFVSNVTQNMFCPYLLQDEAYTWMRDNITKHEHIKIHAIEGDAVTGAVSTYGLGTVYKYTPSVMAIDPDPPLQIADISLLSWLQTRLSNYETLTTTTQIREAYLSHIGVHSMSTFALLPMLITSTNYQLMTQSVNYVNTGFTLQSEVTRDINSFITNTNVVNLQHLMLITAVNGSGQTIFQSDYPHKLANQVTQSDNDYRWQVAIIDGGKPGYTMSLDKTFVNFPLRLTNMGTTQSIDVYLIRQLDYWTITSADETDYYGVKLPDDITGLPINLTINNLPQQVASLARYKWNVMEGYTHDSSNTRRDLSIPYSLNPYSATNNNDGIRHYLWEANRQPPGIGLPVPRGDFGYIRIKSKGTATMHWMAYTVDEEYYTPTLDTYSSYIGSQTLKPFNNLYGAGWDDGNNPPDEHVFEITYNTLTSNFSVVNTKYGNQYFPHIYPPSTTPSTDRPLNFSYTALGWHISVSANNEQLYAVIGQPGWPTGHGTVQTVATTSSTFTGLVADELLWDFDFL